MPPIQVEQLQRLQARPESIRNICIIAHVDHGVFVAVKLRIVYGYLKDLVSVGKTTLADSLLATNGILSSKSAGKVRYLDSRTDEQERGITMKSSAISLYFKIMTLTGTLTRMLGHLLHQTDRGTDVAVVLGDHEREYLINLIDSPGHIDFSHEVSVASRLCDGALLLVDAVEGVCSQTWTVLRQAFRDELEVILVLNKVDRLITELKFSPLEAYIHLEKLVGQINAAVAVLKLERVRMMNDSAEQQAMDDISIAFSPELGNVIFASAVHGWAFRAFFCHRLGVPEEDLRLALWGNDFTYDSKQRSLRRLSSGGKNSKTLFVQLILENMWTVYDAVLMNPNHQKVDKIVGSLGLKVNPFDLHSKDAKLALTSIFSKWLPLASSVLVSVAEIIPNPKLSQPRKIQNMFNCHLIDGDNGEQFEELMNNFKSCTSDGHVLSVVGKLFFVSKESINIQSRSKNSAPRKFVEDDVRSLEMSPEAESGNNDDLIGFARIYSGSLTRGQEIFVLGPKYDPKRPDENCVTTVVERLFIMMGRDVVEVDKIPAGNVFGVQTRDATLFKWSTLSSSRACHPLGTGSTGSQLPVVRVAIEPCNPGELPQLLHGLKLLNQSDAAVQILLQNSGEHVLLTTGELHLERCLQDLRERFANIEIRVSAPIVPFRETVASQEGAVVSITMKLAKGSISMKIRTIPLSDELVAFLNRKGSLIRKFLLKGPSRPADAGVRDDSAVFEDDLDQDAASEMSLNEFLSELDNYVVDGRVTSKNLLAFGPRRSGPNMLFQCLENYDRLPWVAHRGSEEHALSAYENSLLAAFEIGCSAGPLCGEPLSGVGFVVEEFITTVSPEDVAQTAGQLVTHARDAFREAMMKASPRLMVAIYSCEVQSTADSLGRVYGVLNRRRGKILSEEMKEDMSFFVIRALLPVVESFGFGDEVRKRTAGTAQPQLVFSGWETLPEDPFWTPSTSEELEEYGEKGERENFARKCVDSIRKRKGMQVEEKLVVHAEKQRELRK